MKVQKFLAECGIASRRQAEAYIESGRVAVNGCPAKVGDRIDPSADTVTVDGEPVRRDDKVYVVLNKPRGVVTSVKDTHHRKTVLDCIRGVEARIFPVGRLDMDVCGTLLLTNDGELAFRLTHPKYEVDKTYHAWVQGVVTPAEVHQLERGVKLEDGETAPAKASILKTTTTCTLLRLTIHEGRKRLVKRMCAAIGHPVRDLTRISMGPVRANGLVPGEWRYLTDEELASLRRITQLDGERQ